MTFGKRRPILIPKYATRTRRASAQHAGLLQNGYTHHGGPVLPGNGPNVHVADGTGRAALRGGAVATSSTYRANTIRRAGS
jgi:hypothetical protein